MQSCHIVVAVRLNTRMTILRKRRRVTGYGAISASGANTAYTTQPDGLSVRYFTIGTTSEAFASDGLVRRCVRKQRDYAFG